MRFSPLAILALASVAVADFSSWNDVVGDVPQCVKKCTNDFYSDVGFEAKCGSPDKADMKCLCGFKVSTGDARDAGTSLASCYEDSCSSDDLVDGASKIMDFTERFTDLASQCGDDVEKDSEDGVPDAASSLVPGFGAMLVSGALLFASVAF
ncbi:hypothetical protein N7535_005289 [Penicillium sp. DV-2018c]|nr:hypothetical protein N7461_008869 [Penicillium sp. DV-2018c]KAJ5571629.1 hypothetical protein N7535_005289 [Penicillium sp. DV-2018c]